MIQTHDMHVKTNSIDFDWQPWTIDIEVVPDTLRTPAQKRRWAEERAYRLFLCVLDLERDTYVAAADKPRGKPRPGILFKPHSCEMKDMILYGKR